MGHFEPLCCQMMITIENSKKLLMYPLPSPGIKIFKISPKMRHFGGKKIEKVVNQVKLAIPSQSEPHFGEKMEKPEK